MTEFTGNQTELNKALFLRHFDETKGNVSHACTAANVGRRTYYHWCKNDKDFAEKVEDVIENAGDYVESKLLSRIKKDDTTAIIFFCKTKLKSRGYIERQEYANPAGETFNINATLTTAQGILNKIALAKSTSLTGENQLAGSSEALPDNA